MMTKQDDSAKYIEGICPSCEQRARFVYLGEQTWPPEVAEKMNMPEVVELYTCTNCYTTLSIIDVDC